MKVIVFVPSEPYDKNLIESIYSKNDFIIAVDSAVDSLIELNIKIDLAVGDFDSIRDLDKLRDIETIKLDKRKNTTDTFESIKLAYEKSNNVIMIGGITGKRIEHFIANMFLFDKFPNLEIIDNNSKISLLKQGSYDVEYEGYISFFGYESANITLKDFEYPLTNYELNTFDPLCISNELINESGKVIINSGKVIIIKTKK